MEPRKQYTKEFKLDAISLVLDQGFTIAEATRSLEIRAKMLIRLTPVMDKDILHG